MTNENTTYGMTLLAEIAKQLNATGKWDNGSEDLIAVAELCAELRDLGIECHTDGRVITLDSR